MVDDRVPSRSRKPEALSVGWIVDDILMYCCLRFDEINAGQSEFVRAR